MTVSHTDVAAKNNMEYQAKNYSRDLLVAGISSLFFPQLWKNLTMVLKSNFSECAYAVPSDGFFPVNLGSNLVPLCLTVCCTTTVRIRVNHSTEICRGY